MNSSHILETIAHCSSGAPIIFLFQSAAPFSGVTIGRWAAMRSLFDAPETHGELRMALDPVGQDGMRVRLNDGMRCFSRFCHCSNRWSLRVWIERLSPVPWINTRRGKSKAQNVPSRCDDSGKSSPFQSSSEGNHSESTYDRWWLTISASIARKLCIAPFASCGCVRGWRDLIDQVHFQEWTRFAEMPLRICPPGDEKLHCVNFRC
jgi:hypothetical protein